MLESVEYTVGIRKVSENHEKQYLNQHLLRNQIPKNLALDISILFVILINLINGR